MKKTFEQFLSKIAWKLLEHFAQLLIVLCFNGVKEFSKIRDYAKEKQKQ